MGAAREQDKPILLSIGYAACHWCHVMAHESFEDQETAELMNSWFISIKVDREERPDIDQIYMAALNATGEQGGWPLTMFLTPEAKPFWGGTYFPPKAAHGRPSFRDVLRAINDAWRDQRPQLLSGAQTLSDHVTTRLAPKAESAAVSNAPLTALATEISKLIDPELGGLRGAPKFPNVPFMSALWIDGRSRNDADRLEQVTQSLRKMLHGGIYDQLGGGLCRYSVDAQWLIPHFEKMLYDNAQLVSLCVLAQARTGDRIFADAAFGTLDWINRELSVDGGGFASSLDADSDGEEGKFYTWTESEIAEVLGPGAARTFFQTYQLAAPVHWEGNPVIVRRNRTASESSADESPMIGKLLEARKARIRPARDDKVLLDWNGLAIRAFAEAGRYFKRADWIERAARAFRFITESESSDGRLPHSSLGDRRLYPAFSSDYAAMINAAVAMFEATSDRSYLTKARQYADQLNTWYSDGQGGHYLTASDSPDTPIRIRGDSDDPVPSATAQIIDALTRLSSATSDLEIYRAATDAAEQAIGRAHNQIYGQAGIYTATALAQEPSKLVIAENVAGQLAAIAAANPDPRRVDVIATGQDQLPDGFDFGQAPAAWLCAGAICLAPVKDPQALETLLRPH